MKFNTAHAIATAAVGVAVAGAFLITSIVHQPKTFAARWNEDQRALSKVHLPQATIDALHNRALEIVHDMKVVANDDADVSDCVAFKKTSLADTTCLPPIHVEPTN